VGKIKPIWRVPVVLLVLLGILALMPVSYFESPFFNYHSLLPLAPVTTVIMWVMASVIYYIGRWITEREIKRPR